MNFWLLSVLLVLMLCIWGSLMFNLFDITAHLADLFDALEDAL